MLDAGAGDCRYSKHFVRQRYESCDFAQVTGKTYGRLTHVCDIRSIPVESERYDAVLCTQVLAHVPEPIAAIREMRRVLRPGGALWLSAPLFFQENEPPYDFFRFTQHGLRRLLGEAGLEEVHIEWLEGYAGTVAYQLRMAIRELPRRAAPYGGGPGGVLSAGLVWLCLPAMAALSWSLARADVRRRVTSRGMCKNYTVVARRTEP